MPKLAKQTSTRLRRGCQRAQTSEPTTMPAAIRLNSRAYEPTPRW